MADRTAYAIGCFTVGMELAMLGGSIYRRNWIGAAVLAIVLLVLLRVMRPLHRRMTLKESRQRHV